MALTASEVEAACALWRELEGSDATLINHSENHTYLLTTPGQGAYALRVHRPGYQSPAAIHSELAWLSALRRATSLAIPEPVPGRDGAALQSIDTIAGRRSAVLFHFIEGVEPQLGDDLRQVFTTLGAHAATLHDHARKWQRPPGFDRPAWQAASILDAEGLWGNWRTAPGVTASHRPILDTLAATLEQRLRQYGTGADRYGLIHADMRLGNLLVDGDRVALIDFDDCGLCWFAYDFAAAISFHETDPAIPALRSAWLTGYRTVRPMAAEHVAALDSMVMLRRMALLAWIGSHADTQLAQTHMEGFADGTAELARRYLAGSIWS